jgi:PTH1 family peptidyl-tRNA hydrolase
MNESGEAVRRLVAHFGIHFKSDLLVVMDDAALPLGRLRLRASGEDGGHLGLRSIERALGSQGYARLRIGIMPSHPTASSLEEFVLSPFEADEKHRLEEILRRSVASCRLWVTGSMAKAMDYTNKPLDRSS